MDTNRPVMKRYFLVVDDYRTGAIWFYISARSAQEIADRFPTVKILDEEPPWFDDAIRSKIRYHDIDDEPTEYLKSMMKKPS